MLRSIFSFSLSAWFAAVAVFGWCCHGSQQPDNARVGISATTKNCACCHECHQSYSKDNAPSRSFPGHKGCLGVCTSLPASNAKSHLKNLALLDVAISTVPMQADASAIASAQRTGGILIAAAPPLPIHLLYQILLV